MGTRAPAKLLGTRARACAHARRGQPNDFPTTLLTSGTPLPAWHLPCPPAPPPLQPPNELDRFQCLKAHLTTPFCLGTLSLDLILSTPPPPPCQGEEDAEGFRGSCNELKSSGSPSSFEKGFAHSAAALVPLRSPGRRACTFAGPHRMVSALAFVHAPPFKNFIIGTLGSRKSVPWLAGTAF